MIRLGITGGIGVGKSYVSDVFNKMGILVYDSDAKAKELMATDQSMISDIKELLGNQAYNEEGLDREYIATKVFNNQVLLEKLNEIVHPIVYANFQAWAVEQKQALVIQESALLLQRGNKKGLDKLLLVEAPLDTRISRVLSRDPFRTREEIMSIIEKQTYREEVQKLIDYTIVNDNISPLLSELVRIKEDLELTSFT